MNKYEHLLYKRGFILTNFCDLVFEDKMTERALKKWNNIYFEDYNIYIEPSLQHSSYKCEKRNILILGLVINPFRFENDHKTIAKNLACCKNEEDFLDYLDELTGRFTIFSNEGNQTYVYGDAGGTRTIYYDVSSDGCHIVSSHSSLIADLMNYDISQDATKVLSSKEFTGRKYLPGLMSPFKKVKPLTPNTRYVIETKKIERFFPRKNLESATFEPTLDYVTNILVTQSRLIQELYRTSTSLTAGLDSRLTFAIQNFAGGDNTYFTHISRNNTEPFREDVEVAKHLAELYNKQHKVYEYSTTDNDEDFKEFKLVWMKNVGMYRGSVHLFKRYADSYPQNRLHIRSNLAEIVRVYYKDRNGEPDVEKLSKLYTKSEFRNDPLVLESFEDFIETTQFKKSYFYNYNFADLFYWEHRMGVWHSWIVNESDMAYETFVPFNNRKLLNTMLSIPEKERDSDKLFINIIKNIEPNLMNIPVNKNILNH